MKRLLVAVLGVCIACHEAAPRPQPTTGVFREAAVETGLRFHHFNGGTGEHYMPEIIGSGVAVFDIENDGDLDVLLIQGDFLEPGKQLSDAVVRPPAEWKAGTRLFRNELVPRGNLSFTDITDASGVVFQGHGMGAATGDYDGDGFQDLFITGFGRSALYRNNRDGTFANATRTAGIDDPEWGSSAAFVDYDRDGRLDLFVAHYVHFVFRKKQCRAETGEPDYCMPKVFNPAIDRLLHNEGNGRFADVTAASGISAVAAPGLGVALTDFNGDRWPDLYVANDGAASHYWVNQHNGTFREQALEAGTALSMDGKPQAGMGVAVADFDNDGDDDLFKTNLTREGGNLYRNLSRGLFDDASASLGLLHLTRRYTGFGTVWFDYDNDGWLDLLVVNGAVARVEGEAGSPFPYQQPNQLFRNEDGRRFSEATAAAGASFQVSNVGRSVALGDFNNDGRQDVIITSNNERVRLFLNEGAATGTWLQVRLESPTPNHFGVGAVVTVERRGAPALVRLVQTSGSYLAASDIRTHFGLGSLGNVSRLRVDWPDGTAEHWREVEVNRLVVLRQGTGVRVANAGQ